MIWFTSDNHFSHKKIINYERGADFSTVEEMDAAMITRWNEVIGKSDHVYVLGDFAFRNTKGVAELLDKLNGNKTLIEGNHDRTKKWPVWLKEKWNEITPLKEIKVDLPISGGRKRIVLCHFAMRIWNKAHKGAWHLFGHSHGNLIGDVGKSLDVGVDAHNYYPISLEEVEKLMESKPEFETVDHHDASKDNEEGI